MITAKLKVRYEGDWVAQIRDYDVFGLGIAPTFRGREFVGITVLDCDHDDFDDVIETIEENRFVETLEVLERFVTAEGRVRCAISTTCQYPTYTPMQSILMEGFLPIGYTEYRDGYQYQEVLAEDPDDITSALDDLEYETVEVVRIVPAYEHVPHFSLLEWQELTDELTDEDLALLDLAIEHGYYETPARISLEDLAEEAGIAKSTAARRLRNVERAVVPLVTKYLQLFAD